MRTHAAATQLAGKLNLHLAAAELSPTAAVHLDPARAAQSLADGRPVVLIGPPRVEYTTYSEAVATWTLFLIAGPAGDYPAAWPTLDALTAVLREPFDLDTLDPAEFQPSTGPAYPAYAATMTIHYDDLDN